MQWHEYKSAALPFHWEDRMVVDIHNLHAGSLPYCTPKDAISLHLGYPDPRAFPAVNLAEAAKLVLERDFQEALQYCEEQGDPLLRSALALICNNPSRPITAEDIVITQGTTETLDIVSDMLLSKGDVVVMEAPTYLWAIRCFKFRGANLVGIATDEHGMRTDLLWDRLTYLARRNLIPKFIYVIPDFQNPSGCTMSLERRMEFLSVVSEFSIPVIEDSAYVDINFDKEALPTLFELDKQNLVVQARTFSKSVGPGIRLGWAVGPKEFIKLMVKVRQTGASSLISRIVASYIQTSAYNEDVNRARTIYRRKRDAMMRALERSCPDDVTWGRPKGGFYLWLNLPKRIVVKEMYRKAFKSKVLFLSGYDFFCDAIQWNALRLSFSYETEENIDRGISQISELLHECT